MNYFEQVQRDVFHRLLASSLLRDVVIVNVRPRVDAAGNAITDTAIQQTLNSALSGILKRNGKAGATIAVELPLFEGDTSNALSVSGTTSVGLTVTENPVFNMGALGTGLSAEEIALRCLRVLHGFTIRGSNSARTLNSDKGGIIPGEGENGNVVYRVVLARKELVAIESRCAAPAITLAAGNVTIATATAGATLRYTVNGGYPGVNADSGGEAIPGVQNYGGPFAAPVAGTTIRAVASKASFGDSDCVEVLVS